MSDGPGNDATKRMREANAAWDGPVYEPGPDGWIRPDGSVVTFNVSVSSAERWAEFEAEREAKRATSRRPIYEPS